MIAGLAAAWRIGFAHVFAARAEAAVQLLSVSVIAGLNGALWTAAVDGRDSVGGVGGRAVVGSVVLAWVSVSFVASRVNEDVAARIREGSIVADLLRPVPPQLWWYARDLGRACGAFLLQTAPLFLISTVLFDPPLSANPARWLAWLVALLLAHATNFGLTFAIGLAAVATHHTTGLAHLKSTLVSIFSGALVPLALYGPGARALADALPFRAMAHLPATILLGDAEPLRALAVQAAWAVALWAGAAVAWAAARRRLAIDGG